MCREVGDDSVGPDGWTSEILCKLCFSELFFNEKR
jgi:hypothetical protein